MFCLTLVPLLLVPAVYRWWDGRRLRHRADDAALAERWAAHAGRSTRVTLVSVVMVPMLCPEWAIPGMVGVVLLSRAVGYPARRAILGETWSLLAYLEWSARLFIALAGFWALLAWTPYLVNLSGHYAQMTMVLLATALVAWHRWFPQILLRTLRARPLQPGAIETAFADGVARVMEASSARPPSLWRAGPTGGVVANALALPSLRGSSVLFSDSLLESLSSAEATAIFAHEVAHLEYYDRARLRRMAAATLVLIIGAIASVPLTMWLAPNRLWIPIAMWPIAVVVAMALRGRHSQANESASDRRAVELCGDREALASALVKLHTLARIPRRWSPELEQHASHPSLARRLRDIRGQAGAATGTPAAAVIVQGADDLTWVVIQSDRVRHLSGVAAGTPPDVPALVAAAATAVSLPYDQITDLRVVVVKNAGCNLHIVSRDGRKLRCPLRDPDVQRVQAALDHADLEIAPLSKTGADAFAHTVAAICALGAIVVALAGPSWSLMIVAVVSLFQTTPAALAGLSAASAAAAAMMLLTGSVPDSGLVIVAAMLLSAVLLWRAWVWRGQHPVPPEPRWRPLLLAVGVLSVWMVVVLPSTNLLMLHRLVSVVPAAAILPAALAAILWTAVPRRRRSGAIMTVLAAAPLLIAAPQFSDHIVRDPFLARSAPFAVRVVNLSPTASTPAPQNASSLRLSPNGARFLAVVDEDPESEFVKDSRFILGDFAGHRREIAALDATFVDDRRLLVLTQIGGEVRIALDSGDFAEQLLSWQQAIDVPGATDLSVDSTSGRWSVMSRTSDRLFRVDGMAGSVAGRQEWQIPDASKPQQWLPGNGGDAFGWGLEFQYQRINWWPLLHGAGIHIPFWPARFEALQGGSARSLGRTFQETTCQPGPPGSAVLCFLSDGRTTRIWRFDGHRFDLAGTVAGKMIVNSRRSATQTIAWIDGRDAIVDIARQEVLWLDHPLGGCCAAYGWDAVPGLVGAVVDRGESQSVVTWRVAGSR